nr:MAG TPA: hypothetical protein [Caudoviricetes sp.]
MIYSNFLILMYRQMYSPSHEGRKEPTHANYKDI